MRDTLTTDDFLKKLSEGKLKAPLLCTGFVKPLEGNQESFLFSLGASCDTWIKIHASTVEEVEFLREHRCRDHSHPLVRIHFKEPPQDNPIAATFHSLMRASFTDPSTITPPSTLMMMNSDPGDPFGRGGGGFSEGFVRWMIELDERSERGDTALGVEEKEGPQRGESLACSRLARQCRLGNQMACRQYDSRCLD